MGCLFCEFVSRKRKKHINKFPLIIIQETDNYLIFLSAPEEIAENKESDVLIIPKKHYRLIDGIPREILMDLLINIQNISRILMKKFGSCKIILNNGKNAEQYIPHLHFHVIPIAKNGKNPWKNLTLNQYEKISNELKANYTLNIK